MDLNEVLTNPLFVPLLVAIITILSNGFILYLLRKWQYKWSYTITNVQNTYIPIVKEINDRLERLDEFLDHPSRLKWTFETLESTRRSGLFEFIRSHDKGLYQKLTLFLDRIPQKLKELAELQEKTKHTIRADWVQHIKSVVSDSQAQACAGEFVNTVLTDYMFVELLNGRIERLPKIWNETIDTLSESRNLYGRLPSGKRASAFDVSEDEIPKLVQMSQPKLKEVHDLYNEVRDLTDREVVRELVPMMQKYIINPLS